MAHREFSDPVPSDHVGSDSFLDVAYGNLVADPLKEMRRIYDFIGLALTPETERTMQRWIAGNPQNKHGVHRYRLEDFGYTEEGLRQDFTEYRSRYIG